MKRCLGIFAVTTALAAMLLGATPASAATVYGRDCVGSGSYPGPLTLVGILDGTEGLPAGGVITSWKMNVPGAPAGVTQRLKVARIDPGSGELKVAAESAAVPVLTADTGVPARIPVQAKDLIGLSSQGEGGTAYTCEGRTKGDVIIYAHNDIPVGGVAIGSGLPSLALPVQVTIEPDADGDGFGDETQDACPTNPLLQSCPLAAPAPAPPTPSPSPMPPPTPHPLAVAALHRGSVTVKVTTDVAATVGVASRVALGGGAAATPSGGKKVIAAGGTASFTLKFQPALKAKLAGLPRKRKLALQVTVTATSPAGPVGTTLLTQKLPGRAD